MDINALKIELLKKIIACKDKAVLKKIEALLKEKTAKAGEPEENYDVENHGNLLSKEQLEELDRRWKAYKNGTEKAMPWEDVKKEIESKYGF